MLFDEGGRCTDVRSSMLSLDWVEVGRETRHAFASISGKNGFGGDTLVDVAFVLDFMLLFLNNCPGGNGYFSTGWASWSGELETFLSTGDWRFLSTECRFSRGDWRLELPSTEWEFLEILWLLGGLGTNLPANILCSVKNISLSRWKKELVFGSLQFIGLNQLNRCALVCCVQVLKRCY